MTDGKDDTFMSNLAFFDLLLEQFRGAEGELPMATEYLSQAITEEAPEHKAMLIRIAKEKIKNARVLASILLELAKGQTRSLPSYPAHSEFSQLLHTRGIASNRLEMTEDSAERMGEPTPHPLERTRGATSLSDLLRANIATEERQIAVYGQLTTLTSNSHFLSALNKAKRRQIKHQKEFASLLKKISR